MPALRRPGSFVWLCIKICCFSQSLNSYHTMRGRAACQRALEFPPWLQQTLSGLSPHEHPSSLTRAPHPPDWIPSAVLARLDHILLAGVVSQHESRGSTRLDWKLLVSSLEGGLEKDQVNASPSEHQVGPREQTGKKAGKQREDKAETRGRDSLRLSGSPAAWTPCSGIP